VLLLSLQESVWFDFGIVHQGHPLSVKDSSSSQRKDDVWVDSPERRVCLRFLRSRLAGEDVTNPHHKKVTLIKRWPMLGVDANTSHWDKAKLVAIRMVFHPDKWRVECNEWLAVRRYFDVRIELAIEALAPDVNTGQCAPNEHGFVLERELNSYRTRRDADPNVALTNWEARYVMS
jgi:hypothetical protein